MGGCSKWCLRSNIIFVCNIFGRVIIVATCHARDVLNENKFQRGGSPSPIHCFLVQLNREAQKLVQKFCKIMQSGNFPIFEHSFVAYWSSRLYNMQLFKKGMTSNEMLCWSVLCSSWWQASSLNSMRGGTCHSPLQIVTPPLQNVTPLQIVTLPCKMSLLPANCHSPLANCHSPGKWSLLPANWDSLWLSACSSVRPGLKLLQIFANILLSVFCCNVAFWVKTFPSFQIGNKSTQAEVSVGGQWPKIAKNTNKK